jgi:3-hydroxyisobutyrate dehydrogenase
MLRGQESGPVTFDLDSCVKDLRTMLAEGKARGLDLPLVAQSLACFEEVSREGFGDREAAIQSVYWANRKAR